MTISYVNNYFNDQNFDSNEDLNQIYDYNDNENGNNYDYDVLEQDDMNYLETNSQEMDANDYELEVDEDHANYGSNHYDDDEDTKKLKYLVQQLAAEASLSSVNLNGKIILKKENQNNGSAKYKSQNLVNHINTYLNKTNNSNSNYSKSLLDKLDVEELVDNLNNDFELQNCLNYNNNQVDDDDDDDDDENDEEEDEDDKESLDFNHLNSEIVQENKTSRSDIDIDEAGSLLKSDTSDSLIEVDMSLSNINRNLESIYKQHKMIESQMSKPNEVVAHVNYRKSPVPPQYLQHKKSLNVSYTQNKPGQISSTIVRPIKHYHSFEEDANLKKNFNSSIVVPKPLVSSIGSRTPPEITHVSTKKIQPLENIDFNNIKIEKKIRLNYRRPQNLNNLLNFGTLC